MKNTQFLELGKHEPNFRQMGVQAIWLLGNALTKTSILSWFALISF